MEKACEAIDSIENHIKLIADKIKMNYATQIFVSKTAIPGILQTKTQDNKEAWIKS